MAVNRVAMIRELPVYKTTKYYKKMMIVGLNNKNDRNTQLPI
jgi:hypothetical protein